MRKLMFVLSSLAALGIAEAEDAVTTARPVPATRPEMKRLLEDMKQRPIRIPLPELTEEDKQRLGERGNSYESRLRHHYLPPNEGSVFGFGSRRSRTDSGNPAERGDNAERRTRDFRRNADDNMTLSYEFKTMLFWIVSRTNNCQYCLGHQEQKLSAAGLSEEDIAALDSNWEKYRPAEQAAFAYARKLTYEPHLLSDADIQSMKQHYTEMQILEMTLSVAGNNAINRWKEGAGIPQSASNSFARRPQDSAPMDVPRGAETFLTPTPARYQNVISLVVPLERDTATSRPTGRAVSNRPPLESRQEVEMALDKARTRKARLPMLEEEGARKLLGEDVGPEPLPNWIRLLANFPNESSRRIDSINAIDSSTGDLSPLLKAQVSWIVARQDRAWYATGQVQEKLRRLGQTEDQIYALDGDWNEFAPAERSLFQFARHLTATPIALTDSDVAEALKLTGPRQVVQLINFATSRAYFDRVTEAAGLPLDK
jgi:alkylhydroperoxidase family enzyme